MAHDWSNGTGFLDARLRRYIYAHFIHRGRAPKIAELAAAFGVPVRAIRGSLRRLAASHAILTTESGELWRAARFSAVPTAFPVQSGRRSWWANCIWDALGIPAMLHRDARIDASCGCCNRSMPIDITDGRLLGPKGIIHIAVPARQWYEDTVFT